MQNNLISSANKENDNQYEYRMWAKNRPIVRAMQSVNGAHKFLGETELLRHHLNAAASGKLTHFHYKHQFITKSLKPRP